MGVKYIDVIDKLDYVKLKDVIPFLIEMRDKYGEDAILDIGTDTAPYETIPRAVVQILVREDD